MSLITLNLIKNLRSKTGVGIMECKDALERSNGNINKAILEMCKSGKLKAGKLSSKLTKQGLILLGESKYRVIIVEFNSETDFVSRNFEFIKFCNKVISIFLEFRFNNLINFLNLNIFNNFTIKDKFNDLILKFGENIKLRRFFLIKKHLLFFSTYNHYRKIGVILFMECGNNNIAKDLSMHVAAVNPFVVSPNELPIIFLFKEREIVVFQMFYNFKSNFIFNNIVTGRINKIINDNSFLNQNFVKDSKIKVADVLLSNNININKFIRFSLGDDC